MTNLDCIKKEGQFVDKGLFNQGYCQESCTDVMAGPIKKAEHQIIDVFKLRCWRRLLRVLGKQGDQTSQS